VHLNAIADFHVHPLCRATATTRSPGRQYESAQGSNASVATAQLTHLGERGDQRALALHSPSASRAQHRAGAKPRGLAVGLSVSRLRPVDAASLATL
jgi:hypothetical protein